MLSAEKIKARALEIGFHKVGIARAEPLKEEGGRLFEWLLAGYHGEMAWMERWADKRADPTLLLENARSVIAVAMNYFTPHQHTSDESKGKISRYAWGDDYHDVLKEKLVELSKWIEQQMPDAHTKVCVDTAPMMDKVWAARAGIGWIGKSSNLITTDYGSWVFLGEIIIDRALEYDAEIVTDHCGTCTACIDACPTGAITEPYVVDSRRCISYATIELRDEKLPSAFDGKMDGWVYGCDICQDVCPWNRFEKASDEKRFEPRYDETSLALDKVVDLTTEDYAVRFRKSAIKRAKLSGLARNAKQLKKAIQNK